MFEVRAGVLVLRLEVADDLGILALVVAEPEEVVVALDRGVHRGRAAVLAVHLAEEHLVRHAFGLRGAEGREERGERGGERGESDVRCDTHHGSDGRDRRGRARALRALANDEAPERDGAERRRSCHSRPGIDAHASVALVREEVSARLAVIGWGSRWRVQSSATCKISYHYFVGAHSDASPRALRTCLPFRPPTPARGRIPHRPRRTPRDVSSAPRSSGSRLGIAAPPNPPVARRTLSPTPTDSASALR